MVSRVGERERLTFKTVAVVSRVGERERLTFKTVAHVRRNEASDRQLANPRFGGSLLIRSWLSRLPFATGLSVVAGIGVIVQLITARDWSPRTIGLAVAFWMGVTLFYCVAELSVRQLGTWLRPLHGSVWGRFLTCYLAVLTIYGGVTLVLWPFMRDEWPNVRLAGLLGVWVVLSAVLAPFYQLLFGWQLKAAYQERSQRTSA